MSKHAATVTGRDQETGVTDSTMENQSDAATRGTLDVRVAALEHLAEHAATEVDGTVAYQSGLNKLRGRGYPHAQVSARGPASWITLDIAVAWPSSVEQVAAAARDHVRTETRAPVRQRRATGRRHRPRDQRRPGQHPTKEGSVSANKPPRATPVAAVTGSLVAIALIALAVVGIHDLTVTQGWASGHAWARGALDGVNHSTRADWVIPLAVVVLLIGLFLLFVSVKPRRTTHQPVADQDQAAQVWVTPAALTRLAQSAGEDVPGVLDAHSKVSRRRIRVSVHTTPGADRDQISQTATDLVQERIGDLSDLPVKVYTQEARS